MSIASSTAPRTPSAPELQQSKPEAPSRRPLNLKRLLTPFGHLSPTLLLLLVLMVVPIGMVIGYSVLDNVIVNQNPVLVGLSNYADVLSNPVFWKAARNTLVFTAVSVVVHLVMGLAFAMMLNSNLLSNFTRGFFRVILVLPWLFTVAVVAVLWRMMLSPNGVVNYVLGTAGITSGTTEWLADPAYALAALTFINIWSGYPFYMISFLAGLQGIPGDLYEAARVDGASSWQRFVHVTIPQLKPLIISLALLDFIWTTQQFALVWMTTGGGPLDSTEVLSTFTYKLAFSRYEYSLASTSAVIILLVSMVLAYFYARSQKASD